MAIGAGGLGALAAGLVLLIVLGASGYWFREPLADSLVSAKNGLFGTLGLGIAPLSLLAACAAAVALWRPQWFGHVNLWVAGVLLVAFTIGFMGLFEPYKGALAVFTLDGDVTLGGRVGGSMAGSTPWRSVVQLTRLGRRGGGAGQSVGRPCAGLRGWRSGRRRVHAHRGVRHPPV